TVLWYCSDNGALPGVGSKGEFRGNKGNIYDGGLLVPGILEWPAAIPAPQVVATRCNTFDIYPTLLDIVDVAIEGQPPLDGESLLPLLTGKASERTRGMGFWNFQRPGIRTPSDAWMRELLAAQAEGRQTTDPERLRLDAAEIRERHEAGDYRGH